MVLLLKLNSQFPFVGESRYEVRDTRGRREDGGAEKAQRRLQKRPSDQGVSRSSWGGRRKLWESDDTSNASG